MSDLHIIEIAFNDREAAERLYDFLEHSHAVMSSGGTLSLHSETGGDNSAAAEGARLGSSGDNAVRLEQRAWQIVHEYGPAWANDYWRRYPNSKASEIDLRDQMAHYCVVAALRNTQDTAERARIVAWLHDKVAPATIGLEEIVHAIARAIERNDHARPKPREEGEG